MACYSSSEQSFSKLLCLPVVKFFGELFFLPVISVAEIKCTKVVKSYIVLYCCFCSKFLVLFIALSLLCMNLYIACMALNVFRKGLAEALLKIYMNFFKSLVHKNETRDQDCHNKMMAELLTGIPCFVFFMS